jgi:CBS domain-containing protein
MNVARILKDKGRNVVTVKPDTSLGDIIRLLAKHKIGGIVVCNDDLYVEGIITERDFMRILAESGPNALSQPVKFHMTKDVHTCTIHDNVDWLMEVMTEHRFRHMPVVENNRLTGIISIGDVVKQRLAIAEFETMSMREYIATG